MEPTAQQLFASALHLPDSERAELAARLIESLDSQVDDDLDVAWGAEIRSRLAELDSGKVTTIPWPEARRMIMGGQHGPSTD
jgi:putative addiction module component (TIGR02574 family)